MKLGTNHKFVKQNNLPSTRLLIDLKLLFLWAFIILLVHRHFSGNVDFYRSLYSLPKPRRPISNQSYRDAWTHCGSNRATSNAAVVKIRAHYSLASAPGLKYGSPDLNWIWTCPHLLQLYRFRQESASNALSRFIRYLRFARYQIRYPRHTK